MEEIATIALSALPADDQPAVAADEYIAADGLIHCRACGSRRQKRVVIMGQQKTVRCLCECGTKKRDELERQQAVQQAKVRIEQIRRASLIEGKLQQARLSTFQRTANNEKLFGIIRRYVENFQKMFEDQQGVLFWGPVESGKSYAAACIANELMDRDRTVVMTSFVKILSAIKNTAVDESEFIGQINSASLLIIDDLGTERNTDYALEKVYEVIDSRYRTGKPLILTTNLSLNEMKSTPDIRYQRIYSRIFEMCYPVMVAGDQWRRGQAADRFDNMKKLLEGAG